MSKQDGPTICACCLSSYDADDPRLDEDQGLCAQCQDDQDWFQERMDAMKSLNEDKS